ncbi:MAG: MFS transporter [Caldilineaceae bacterium]|nr:MFS transporter [Caldilineaceae bacterium]
MTTHTQANTPAVGYAALVRGNPNFRNLWLGQIVSLLGDWFNLIASAALVGALTQSGLAIGSLFVVRMLAPFLISPIAGVVADRYNRKHILIAADLVRAVTVFGFLFVREPGHVWILYTLTAVQLALSGFFFPARNAILPDVTTPEELGAANALSSATWSVMLAVGAALGGLVSGTWGIYPAFVIDGLTFLLSAFFIWQVRVHSVPSLAASDKSVAAAVGQYVEGLRYLRQNLDVLAVAVQKGVNSFFLSSGFQVLQVAIAQDVFVIGEGGGVSLGLMFALAGVGTGLGPILARRYTGDRNRALRWAIALGYLIGGAGMVLTAPLTSFGVVLLGTALRGIGGGMIWVFSTQLLLQTVPGQVRGRVFAMEFAIFYLASAAASSLVGAGLDTSLGISGVIWWMAGLSLIPAGLWTFYVWRKGQTAVTAP